MNLYVYAGSNPISFADPFGLCKAIKGTTAPCELFGAVWAEGRGASKSFQNAVAGVILNRASHHGGDVNSVVWAKRQFSFTLEQPPKDGNMKAYERAVSGSPTKAESAAFHDMVNRVEQIYSGETADPSNGATLYYSPKSMQPKNMAPYWVNEEKMESTLDLGGEGQFLKCKSGAEKC